MKTKPRSGWGLTIWNGHDKPELMWVFMRTRQGIYDNYPHVKGRTRYKVVKVSLRVTPREV